MEFSKQEYWSGWPCASSGDLPTQDWIWFSCTADRLFTMWATTHKQLFIWHCSKKHLVASHSFKREQKGEMTVSGRKRDGLTFLIQERTILKPALMIAFGIKSEKGVKNEKEVKRKHTGHNKHPLPRTQEKTLHRDTTRWSTPKSDWLYSLQPKMEKLHTVSKNKTGSWLWLRSWTPYCQIQTEKWRKWRKPLDHSGMT